VLPPKCGSPFDSSDSSRSEWFSLNSLDQLEYFSPRAILFSVVRNVVFPFPFHNPFLKPVYTKSPPLAFFSSPRHERGENSWHPEGTLTGLERGEALAMETPYHVRIPETREDLFLEHPLDPFDPKGNIFPAYHSFRR